MKFSQRMGITPATKEMQSESMDDDLRNRLWNAYNMHIAYTYTNDERYRFYYQDLWIDFLNLPIDSLPDIQYQIQPVIRSWFYKAQWFEVYDFIEKSMHIAKRTWILSDITNIENAYNKILEREFSSYRFILGLISPITNEQEIQSLNNAIDDSGKYTALKGCNLHLKSALHKLSDRNNPDYRNSIKESISAVESTANVISGNVKDSLGDALSKIKSKIDIHPALEKGFRSIYGYTSDSAGIRHAMTDSEEAKPDFEDAKFMLVSCSAFINYLIGKAQKAGITFS